MSFTRFKYDNARTHKYLQQSTDPSRYILNVPGNNGDKPLFLEDPHIRLQKWGANVYTNPIDVSSDLDGRSRKQFKYCSPTQYPNNILHNSTQIQNVEVGKSFTDETRTSHPSWLYRDLEQTRWEYPIFDPQENVCKHFYNNVSTRILEKNTFNQNPQKYYEKH